MADEQQTSTTDSAGATTTDTQPDKSAGTGGTQAQTFTQEDVNKIVGARAKDAKQTAINDLLKELGFEKPEDLKQLVTTAKQAEDEKKTNEQKLQDQIALLTRERDDEKQRAVDADGRRKASIITSRLEALATKAKAEIPADVVDYLNRNHAADLAALLGDDERVNDKKAEALVELVRTARPSWFVKERGVGSPSVAGGRNVSTDDKAEKRAAATSQRIIRG